MEAEIVKSVIEAIQNYKEIMIKELLAEKGIVGDSYKMINRRFPRLQKEIDGDIETYYYDNGTSEGLKICSFLQPKVSFNFEDIKSPVKISVETIYH